MKIYILPILLIQIILCLSCSNGKYEMIFSDSESLLETDPDSALLLLNSIFYPEELKEKEYNRYVLLKIQAEYKSYQDITSDSSIFLVKDYYLKKGDIHNIALSSYYCGCYYKDLDKKENAMKNFLFALDFVGKTNDDNLKGLIVNAIGVVLLDQFDCETAMHYFHESALYYKEAGNLKNEIISYIQIGDCFQLLGEIDSALYYYKRCLHIVDENKLHNEQSYVRQNLGILYSEMGEFSNAIQNLEEALYYEIDLNNKIKIYNILSELYIKNNQIDSANLCMDYLFQNIDSLTDMYVKANIFKNFSDKEELRENYLKALEYHKLYSDNLLLVFDDNLDDKLLKLQKKYDYEKIRLQNIRLKLNRTYYIIYIVLFLLVVFVFIFIFYKKYEFNRYKISLLEERILQLKSMADSLNEKEKTFRSYLLRHFDILKKVSCLEICMVNSINRKNEFWVKKFNEIVYGKDTLEWSVLYEVMNDLHDDFFTKLRNMYPLLSEMEFRIICLTYTKFSSEEISLILGLSVNTVNTKRSAIRKSLGIHAFGNLNEFLDEKLNK